MTAKSLGRALLTAGTVAAVVRAASAPAAGTVASPEAVVGPNTMTAPYVLPIADGVTVTSLLTVNDAGSTNYRHELVGIPDGIGLQAASGGRVQVTVDHELSLDSGIVRRHGGRARSCRTTGSTRCPTRRFTARTSAPRRSATTTTRAAGTASPRSAGGRSGPRSAGGRDVRAHRGSSGSARTTSATRTVPEHERELDQPAVPLRQRGGRGRGPRLRHPHAGRPRADHAEQAGQRDDRHARQHADPGGPRRVGVAVPGPHLPDRRRHPRHRRPVRPSEVPDQGSQFITNDEESSGIIEAEATFGTAGRFLFDARAHTANGLPTGTGENTVQESVENGQLLRLDVADFAAVYAPG